MRSDALSVIDAEPDEFAFCMWRNVAILVWWARATGASVERLRTASRRAFREHPEGVSCVHVIREGAGLPEPEARSGLMALARAPGLAAVAVIVGGEGFWASALRGAVTGLWLAVPRAVEMRISGSIEEVAGWLPDKHGATTGVYLEPAELAEAMAQASTRELTHANARQGAQSQAL